VFPRLPAIQQDGANLSKVEDAQDFIRQFVPDAVWDEMDFRQAAFEAYQSD
jgi:hypothetical protein